MEYNKILEIAPFSLDKTEKDKILTEGLKELSNYHIDNCKEYKKMMQTIGYDESKVKSYYDLPFLPVSLFKDLELKSIANEEIFKTMTSSGTTGQAVAKIYLDKATASNQQKTLVKIVSEFTGGERLPMLIIDCPSVVKNRAMFSARGAGILGFSIFGAGRAYALDDNMEIDIEGVEKFLDLLL